MQKSEKDNSSAFCRAAIQAPRLLHLRATGQFTLQGLQCKWLAEVSDQVTFLEANGATTHTISGQARTCGRQHVQD